MFNSPRRNECDGNGTFGFGDYNKSLMFPSMDPDNTASYDPTNPKYCEFYKPTITEDGECSFDTSQTLECR